MHRSPPIRPATLSTLPNALLAALCALWAASAQPVLAEVTLALDPDVTQVDPLGTVDVAVTIVGLGDGLAPSVGVFELDVSFDPSRLSLGTPEYGDPLLGDQLGLQEVPQVATDTSVQGLANLFELSLDSVQDLDTMQAPAFTMITLPFTALKAGPATVDLTIETLGDATGAELVAVASGTTLQVPEPLSALAGAVAIASLGAVRRRRRSAMAAMAAVMLLSAPSARAQSALPGDIDQNGRVDRADLAIVTRDRGLLVEESGCGPACDLDGDGSITALDARILASLCTDKGCGTAPAATGSGSQH